MTSLFGILDISKKALFTQQQGISTVGHNVSNVNTPGYSKQRINVTNVVEGNFSNIGAGVEVQNVERMQESFIEKQIMTAMSDQGKMESRDSVLIQVEPYFNETISTGLDSSIEDFFNSLRALSANPAGTPERTQVKMSGQTVVDRFHRLYNGLNDLKKNLNTNISSSITDINGYASEIATLNTKIMQLETSEQQANDLRDMRMQSMKELSKLVDFSTFEDSNGHVHILLAGGKAIVEGSNNSELETSINADGLYDVYFVDNGGSSTDITSTITKGKLGGYLVTRDTEIDSYITKLNTLASEFATRFDQVHMVGYATDDATGYRFFNDLSGVDNEALNIDLSTNLQSANGINYIAAATEANLDGDNRNAVALIDLQKEVQSNLGSKTFNGYTQSIVSEIAVDKNENQNNMEFQDNLLFELQNFRESQLGVNIDEELMNLSQYQKTYQASGKVISIVDRLMDTIFSFVG